MNIKTLLIFFLTTQILMAQDSLTVDVNVLKDIQSPAANLLGIANSDISKPSDPTAFMLNIRQATNNFTEVPLNYAVDLAPALLFDKHNLSGDHYIGNNTLHNIWQSMVVSFAINNSDIKPDTATIKNTALALGVKFSLLRGKMSKKSQKHINKSLELARSLNHKHAEVVSDKLAQDEEWQKMQELLDSDSLTDSDIQYLTVKGQHIMQRISGMAQAQIDEDRAKFQKIAENIDMDRTGFKLDFNAALSFNFPEQIYANGSADKLAAWLTASQDWECGFSLLAIARYLYDPDEAFLDGLNIPQVDDLSLFNAGIKLQYKKNKFAISGEYLDQHIFNNEDINSGYKFLINTQYEVDKNLVLTLSFGRDFNNNYSESGNVISALNFIKGFGSKRTLSEDINKDFKY